MNLDSNYIDLIRPEFGEFLCVSHWLGRKPFPIAHLDMKSLNVMLTCKYPFHSVTTGANGDLDAAHDSAQSNTNTTSPNSPMLSSRGKSYGVIAKIIDFGASCVCDEAGKVPESEGTLIDRLPNDDFRN